MTTLGPDTLAERAEDAMVALRLPPSAVRVCREGYVAANLPNPNPLFGRVDRLRLSEDSVDRTVADVRGWFAGLGRERFCWWVGRHARPTDLAERLLAAGAVLAEDPDVVAMVLEREPPPVPGIEVRPVVSLADYEAQRDIRLDAFRFTDEQKQVAWSRTETGYLEYLEDGNVTLCLATLDGVPVAAAGVAFTADRLALLLGGATLAYARGRGAYRALVRARWEEAQRRGADAVVVHAGRMSRPTLERLGLRIVSSHRVLVDASQP